MIALRWYKVKDPLMDASSVPDSGSFCCRQTLGYERNGQRHKPHTNIAEGRLISVVVLSALPVLNRESGGN